MWVHSGVVTDEKSAKTTARLVAGGVPLRYSTSHDYDIKTDVRRGFKMHNEVRRGANRTAIEKARMRRGR